MQKEKLAEVAPGFTTVIHNGITVSVGEVARVDLKLGVGHGDGYGNG